MRATVMYAAGDVRVPDVPDAALAEPSDAILRVGIPDGYRTMADREAIKVMLTA